MDDKDEDEEEQMVDMEIAVIDQTNDCSLIFSDSPSFSEVSDLVNDIFNDQKIELEVQECMNDLLDSVEKEVKIKKKLTRKRSINNMEWQRNKRKRAHEAGEEYVSSRGKKVAAKSIKPKKDCMSNCKFKCDKKIDKTSQEKIFMDFYKLDNGGKHNLNQTTTCTTASSGKESSRRKKSYSYYFMVGEESFRVCKSYYLSTLAVSQKMIYNVHEKKNPITGVVKADGRGKKCHSNVTKEQREIVIAHINSFPVIDSHYCRAKTNKKYVQPGLNIERMYDLYKSHCSEKGLPFVKSSYYRHVFNTEFNIGFHVPKTDRCEKCEEIKVKKNEKLPVSEEEEKAHKSHLAEKVAMRAEKAKDKANSDKNTLLVVFDLENVITLPKAEVGSFFYKRKLTMYNLTAMTSSKRGYCAIWTEAISGRAGNDIASAFISILKKISIDEPHVTNLICWSDSCVPQNRNSHISQAILEFLYQQEKISSIIMKYSIAGHSGVQEVDNMHKQIEDAMKVAEFYSPVSFLRLLLNVNRNIPYRVIQLNKVDFKDYQSSSKMRMFSRVPYTKVCQLKFDKENLHIIEYKQSHSDENFTTVNIGHEKKKSIRAVKKQGVNITTIESNEKKSIKILTSRCQKCDKQLSTAKIEDIRSMLKHMPLTDREYFKTLGV